MNVRDPSFTARLERALTILANQPARMLSYLEDRFELETGELQAWLDEFNGGAKALKFARIHEVKRELGGHDVLAQVTKPVAPEIMRDAPENAHIRITPARAPVGEKSLTAVPDTLAAAPARPRARVEEPRPAQPRMPAASPAPAAADADRPWLRMKVLRGTVYQKWRPVLVELTRDKVQIAAACRRHNLSYDPFWQFGYAWLGGFKTTTPELIKEFLAWGDAKLGISAAPTEMAKAEARDALHGDGWDQWRSDAIAALRTMGTPARRAALQVDAAIKELNGEDCDVGELVKRAMRQQLNGVAPEPAADKRAAAQSRESRVESRAAQANGRPDARGAAGSQPGAGTAARILAGGTLFKIEVIVRLVPADEVTP